jgi:hypothetical protein
MTNEAMALVLDERAKMARAWVSVYAGAGADVDDLTAADKWQKIAEASEAGAAALRALEKIADLNRYEGVPEIECLFCEEEGGDHLVDCPTGIALTAMLSALPSRRRRVCEPPRKIIITISKTADGKNDYMQAVTDDQFLINVVLIAAQIEVRDARPKELS